MGQEDSGHGRTVTTQTTPSQLLFAEDLAVKFNMPRQKAHRWLKWLEAQHGHLVVGQFPSSRGIRRYTTEAALESIGPAARHKFSEFQEKMAKLGCEVRLLRRDLEELRKRFGQRKDVPCQ